MTGKSESELMESIGAFEEDYHAEKRVADNDNETIVFQAGYTKSTPGGWPAERVWFCRVTKQGLTVEDYAKKKRTALRLARKAWQKAKDKQWREQYGYPRVIT